METEKSNVDELITHVEEYFQTKQDLVKMIAAEKSSVMISSVVTNLVIVFIFFIVFIFASIALAYGISQMIGEAYSGFLAVAVIYLVIGLTFYFNRDKWLKMPMANAIVKNFFKDHHHE